MPRNFNTVDLLDEALPNFTQVDLNTLCAQHTEETGQEFTTEALVRIFGLTHGQRWLVNALAWQWRT